jgi:hypothetical protein
VNTAPSSPFIVRYHASGFPAGMVKSNDYIQFHENELIHALFTVSRAPGDRLSYGEASVWELLHRSSLVRAYIRQDNSQHLVLSRLASDLDRSEKVAVSYAIGQAMTAIFSRQLLPVQFLMHVERYASRWSVRFASRKRPDLRPPRLVQRPRLDATRTPTIWITQGCLPRHNTSRRRRLLNSYFQQFDLPGWKLCRSELA